MSIQPGHIANTDNRFSCRNCKNKNCYINRYIPTDQLALMTQMKSVFTVKKNKKVFSVGQLVEGIFFIYKGKVKITYEREGKEQLIRLAKDGAIVGHRGINRQMIYPINAFALEDITLCFMPMESFLKAVSEYKDFSYEIMMFFADELKHSEEASYDLSTKNHHEKIAYGLMKFIDAFGIDEENKLKYAPTIQELSDMLAIDRQEIQEGISALVDHDIIESKKGDFIVKKAMMLKGIAKDSELITHTKE